MLRGTINGRIYQWYITCALHLIGVMIIIDGIDRNDRAIRTAVRWYSEHLRGIPPPCDAIPHNFGWSMMFVHK
jgi:hypothetical protein